MVTGCFYLRPEMPAGGLQDLSPHGFVLIEVPHFAAGDDPLPVTVRCNPVLCQDLVKENQVFRRDLGDHRVGAEAADHAADEQNGLVHRVTEGLPGVAGYDDRSFLPHESGHITAVAADDEHAALD